MSNDGELELLLETGEIAKAKLKQCENVSVLAIFSTHTISKTIAGPLEKMGVEIIVTPSDGPIHALVQKLIPSKQRIYNWFCVTINSI